MRKAIYKALEATGKKVFHVSDPAKKSVPFYQIGFGTPVESKLANFSVFYVTVYAKAGDVTTLDAYCDLARKTLNKVRLFRALDGTCFVPEYKGETNDFVNDDLAAVGKMLTFNVPRVGNEYL